MAMPLTCSCFSPTLPFQRKNRVAYFYDPDIGQYYYGKPSYVPAAACSPLLLAVLAWPNAAGLTCLQARTHSSARLPAAV